MLLNLDGFGRGVSICQEKKKTIVEHLEWTLSFLEGAHCCNRRLQLADSSDVTTEERE